MRLAVEADNQFIETFERCGIPKDQWTHKAHIRMAWYYLKQESNHDAAVGKIREGIKRLNLSHGNLTGYHETVTQLFALYISTAIKQASPSQGFEEFFAAHPWLYDGKNPFRKRHYSDELWKSEEARHQFVRPDLAPLPVAKLWARFIERAGLLISVALAVGGIIIVLSHYFFPSALHAAFYPKDFFEQQMSRYAAYPITTFLHLVPGALFLVIGLLQFQPKLRARYISLHRWLGRAYMFCGLLLCGSAFSMVARFPYAGRSEACPIGVFGVLLLYSLVRAYVEIRRRNLAKHQEWVIRSFAIGIGISMVRLVFLALRPIVDSSDQGLFLVSLWAGWTITFVGAEIWIRMSRKRPLLNAVSG
jgi:uncharacterized membrane protein